MQTVISKGVNHFERMHEARKLFMVIINIVTPAYEHFDYWVCQNIC